MSDRLKPLGAYVEPFVAAVLVREGSRLLRELEAYGQNMVVAGRERRGHEVLDSVGRLRESAQQYKAAYGGRRPAATSDAGNAEVPTGGDGTSSEPFSLVVREAAEMLGRSERQVTNMCRKPDGGLSAVFRGGRWFIDELSVIEELRRRKERADE
ncbi:helix-turn-helix domain-containing protein [Nocardioides antri]|uniref:Helix-turn-helix domain-containing protein n=1 Tax=Nocardioides antri TaxID=2607659 RepID=A0A5B1M0K4_9ACTN|nr:helix-turn-helix domain-containing protein [Nocardioides antri]KAA1426463.1 helix-turn-helix domain-containing protein [Nocardioides antri]